MHASGLMHTKSAVNHGMDKEKINITDSRFIQIKYYLVSRIAMGD
jgi:hypothetical protein